MRVSQAWLLTVCLASHLVVSSTASPPRKLLQSNDVFPWFTGTANSRPDKSDSTNNTSGSSAPAPGPSNSNNGRSGGNSAATNTTEQGDNAPHTCPIISLKLNSIEVYDNIINEPDKNLVVVCYNKEGMAYPPVIFNTSSDVVRSISGARYRPSQSVAQIGCGESISCTVAYTEPDAPNVLTAIAEGGCWFDYRHFTQLSYQEPMSAWTCTKPPVRYTLECVECTDPDFPWDDALALAGPPLSDTEGLAENPTLNSVMVIISVSIVAGAVILVVTALLLRGRRRTIEENVRVTELIMARSRENANSQRRRRSSFKPPAVFVVGKPLDGPPPPGYTGPIVVLHCEDEVEGEEQGEEDSSLSLFNGEKYSQKEKEDDVEIEGDGVSGSGSGSSRSSRNSSGNQSEDGWNSSTKYHEGILRWPQIAIARPEVIIKVEEVEEEQTPVESGAIIATPLSDELALEMAHVLRPNATTELAHTNLRSSANTRNS